MKYFHFLTITLFWGLTAIAQSPQKMSYQMVVRNSSNVLLSNQTIGVRISLLQGSANGNAVFVETHLPTTNANGLASLVIGDGTIITGSFAAIDWANGPFFIKTETDPTGGTNYTITGTSQLMSVPYALFAGSTPNLGKTHLVISGDLSDSEAAAKIAAEAGPNTQFVWIQYTSKLTTVNLSGLSNLVELVVQKNKELSTIIFPNLITVSSKLSIVDNNQLTGIFLPALYKISGVVDITTNKRLTSISVPSLVVTGDLLVNNNQALVSLSFPALKKTGDLSLKANLLLNNLSIPVLDTITSFFSESNKFVSIAFPALTTIIGGESTSGQNAGFYLYNDPLLNSLSFPILKKRV